MTWTRAADAQRYGSPLLEGDRIRFRALEEGDLPALVRWWRDPEWAVLQQILVRPRPEEPVVEMFRSWSKSKVGYHEEGVRREAVFHDGRFHDEVIMSVLARDWTGGSSSGPSGAQAARPASDVR